VIFDEMKKWDWSKSEKKDSINIVYEELESNGMEAHQNEERRPNRTRQMPTRLQEFEITPNDAITNEGYLVHLAFLVDSEPVSVSDALKHPKEINAMNEEL
jgi:hypothetical protein